MQPRWEDGCIHLNHGFSYWTISCVHVYSASPIMMNAWRTCFSQTQLQGSERRNFQFLKHCDNLIGHSTSHTSCQKISCGQKFSCVSATTVHYGDLSDGGVFFCGLCALTRVLKPYLQSQLVHTHSSRMRICALLGFRVFETAASNSCLFFWLLSKSAMVYNRLLGNYSVLFFFWETWDFPPHTKPLPFSSLPIQFCVCWFLFHLFIQNMFLIVDYMQPTILSHPGVQAVVWSFQSPLSSSMTSWFVGFIVPTKRCADPLENVSEYIHSF